MGFTFDNTAIGSEDDLSGSNRPAAGRYHVRITAVDESLTKHANAVLIDMEVLDGTTPDQRGKVHCEYYHLSEKAVVRLQKLSLATGLTRPGEVAQVNLQDLVGRQLVVELVDKEYERDGETRQTVRMSYMGMWSVGHPDVKDVPKDAGAMRAPVAASAATSPAADKYANL